MIRLRFKSGQILILAIVFLAVILILAASLFGNIATFLRLGARSIAREQASSMAEAGLDYTVWQLNKTAGSFTPPLAETKIGTRGSFIVTITTQSSTLKTVTSTGYIPNATNPQSKRTIKADVAIDSQAIAFRYAMQTGTGDLTMRNSSTINGNVYSNGNITGSGSSAINGDAYAVGTISSPDPTANNKYPGASPQPLPTIDYDYWKKAACNNDPGYPTTCQTAQTCSPTCTISSSQNIGTKKYVGNLRLSNNAVITLDGPVWITGNFSMTQGGTTLKLNNNFGSNGTVFIIDGTAELNQGGQFQPTNSNPPGYIMLVATSDLNNVILSQSGATAIFYTLDGTATLHQSATVVSVVAKALTMQNSASLTYDQGLASASFTTGPGASWLIKKGTYRYTSSP